MEADKELAHHMVAYAMLMKASGVITERQYEGIRISFDVGDDFITVCNRVMFACNQAYENKLKEMIDSKSLIIKP